LPRGFEALQARYGKQRWQEAVGRAQQVAVRGLTVTQQLLSDLQQLHMAGAEGGGQGLQLGEVLPQNAVAATLSQLRTGGPRSFYTGELASRLVSAGVPADQLANWMPVWRAASAAGNPVLAFPDTASGRAAQAAYSSIAAAHPMDAAGTLAAVGPSTAGADTTMGTTGFVVTDANGGAVSCAIGIGSLFGSTKLIEGLDIYGSAPLTETVQAAMIPILGLSDQNFSSGVAAGGSVRAPAEAAASLWLGTQAKISIAEAFGGHGGESRVNAVICPGGVPDHGETCSAATDPRGSGFGLIVDRVKTDQ
jgi:gamma-glutamyltranspeptidase/glutathione hydrolase